MATVMADTHIDRVLEEVPRPVVAHSAGMTSGDYRHVAHNHRKAELLFAPRGFVTCSVEQDLWIVAPQCALWIPPGMEHSVQVVGCLELYILFIEPDAVPNLPTDSCTLNVSSLLKELLMETTRLPRLYDQHGSAGRFIHTVLDQIVAAPTERLRLPMPADKRLRKLAVELTANPADRATIDEWARRIGMSERTLFRLITQQTGMSFGRWRQQFQILFALKRMAEGESVKSVAFELGYETVSSFIAMFKKTLGQPPGRYYADMHTDLARAARH